MLPTWDEMAVVGHVARPHGLKGDVVVNPETDFPEQRFAPGAELFVQQGGQVQSLTVARARMQQGRPVIGLDGVHDVDGAQALAGVEFRVPTDRLTALPAGTFYRHALVGCTVVTVDGAPVGTVREVEGTTGGSRLVLEAAGGEILVPLADEICVRIAPDERRIVIQPPEGLLDLNVTGPRRRRARRGRA
ncbi:MAG: ribosome maturation factor RimM [Vicinamibacterales bacterium]